MVIKCPKCGYPQYCGCDECIKILPQGYKPWNVLNGELHQCPKCGFTAHYAEWLDIAYAQITGGNCDRPISKKEEQ